MVRLINSTIKGFLSHIGLLFFYSRDSKVLYLHDVHNARLYPTESPSMYIGKFKKVVDIVCKNGFEIVDVITKKKGQIQICFDDGFRGIWDNREFFYENNIKPTVFLVVAFIGTEGYLTKDEIAELAKHGFLFESHTVNHISITDEKYSDDQIRKELLDSKKYLESMLGREVKSICIPRGFYNAHRVEIAKEYYENIYSCIPGSFYDRSTLGMIPRNIIQDASLCEMKSILFGGQKILKNRYKNIQLKNACSCSN